MVGGNILQTGDTARGVARISVEGGQVERRMRENRGGVPSPLGVGSGEGAVLPPIF